MRNKGRQLSFDDMVAALGERQQRKLLVALSEHNPQDDIPAVLGSGSDPEAVEDLVKMHHVYLPNLAENGFIEWDRETHDVSKGPEFEEIRPLLELLTNHEDELPPDWL